MNTLKLIRNKTAVRKYKKRPISLKTAEKIVEAGLWGPSIHKFQPWKFVVILNKAKRLRLIKAILERLKKAGVPSFLLFPTIKALAGRPPLIVAVYNEKEFTRFTDKFDERNASIAQITELSAIAAAMQNMLLAAESLGVGSCWLDIPLFCEREINACLRMKDKLAGLLVFGYPDEKVTRAKRKDNKVIYL